MKKLIIYILLISNYQICFSQIVKIDTLKSKFNNVFSKEFEKRDFANENKFMIKPLIVKSKSLFTVYNTTTGLNDSYNIKHDTISINKSILINELNFRGQKIDSFNPSGTSSIGWALFFGVYNLLFEEK